MTNELKAENLKAAKMVTAMKHLFRDAKAFDFRKRIKIDEFYDRIDNIRKYFLENKNFWK